MRFFRDYMLYCIHSVAQDSASSSRDATRDAQSLGTPLDAPSGFSKSVSVSSSPCWEAQPLQGGARLSVTLLGWVWGADLWGWTLVSATRCDLGPGARFLSLLFHL